MSLFRQSSVIQAHPIYNFVKRLYHSMKLMANINFIIFETIKIIDKGMVFDKM